MFTLSKYSHKGKGKKKKKKKKQANKENEIRILGKEKDFHVSMSQLPLR